MWIMKLFIDDGMQGRECIIGVYNDLNKLKKDIMDSKYVKNKKYKIVNNDDSKINILVKEKNFDYEIYSDNIIDNQIINFDLP